MSREVSRTCISPHARNDIGIRRAHGYARSAMPSPRATPITASDADLAAVQWDAKGLAPAIIQEQGTGQVLMLGWMNAESLRRTLDEGRTVFWSRSRGEYWRKGDTSGDRQWVREAYYDCDGDALLFVVEQEGAGACHTGEHSCFFRTLGAPSQPSADS
jgi:phosphoribosyl-AMP cyclohydrolase